jgi:seryl-tRNA synthetase
MVGDDGMNFLLGGWKKWAAVGAVVAGLMVYIGWVKWDNATLQVTIEKQQAEIVRLDADVAEAVRVANANAKTAERVKADAKRAMEAVAKADARERAANEKLNQIQRELLNVPSSERVSIGPHVRDAVKRLWEDPAAASGN